MGKIKMTGTAKRELKADIMNITITVSDTNKTSFLAIEEGKKQTEKVLQLLIGLGFDISDITMDKEVVEKSYKEDVYVFEKRISVKTAADMMILELISDGIAKNGVNAIYDEEFGLSDFARVKSEVLREALMDSRRKVTVIVDALGKKIVGLESAQYADCCKWIDEQRGHGMLLREGHDSLSSKLSPGVILVKEEMEVTWMID
ncbi:MAG: SIMPL domain-containing protein [Clostridia bacterium]|nr:SIMPL domain-containing protein [Clostridia bacterium]